jgi:phage tail sheath protein FI
MANSKRRDPYRNFNFLAAIGAAVGGTAVLGLVRRLFTRVERRAPGVYVEEKPAGTRPIEGVGTSTAGFAGRVLVGRSVVAAACELTCAMGSHHHNAPASTAAPCHEHQGAEQTAGVRANSSALCHESGDLPSAVIDAWLTTLVVPATPATTVAVAAALSVTSIVRAHDRGTVLDPRPPHRPLRV